MGGVAEVFVDCCRPDEADERPDADADEGVKQAEHTIAHHSTPTKLHDAASEQVRLI